MTKHFGVTGLSYEVMVTTTHKRTGQVKTGAVNTVARNKVRGNWSGDVPTLTAGASGHHELEIEVGDSPANHAIMFRMDTSF